MSTITKTRPLATFSGKGKAKREAALLQVSHFAFCEAEMRAAHIANLTVCLGDSPTEQQLKAARTQTIVGYVASRLPAGELPKGKAQDAAARIERATVVVCQMAAPVKAGAKAKKLRAGQVGRRSDVLQRIVRAAEERASRLFAECGFGQAKTIKEKNAAAEKAKRAPSMAGSGKGKAKEIAAPSHAQLVSKPAAPVSSNDYVQHMQLQIAALCDYDKKHAKKRPTTHGEFAEKLAALRQIANKAANDYEVRKAAAEAKADA